MKRYLLLILSIYILLPGNAQLQVKEGSFKEVPGFVNINPDPNYQYDDNDIPFAVIKVRTENINDKQRRELIFNGNAGTFIMLEYKDGEVWVYLTAKYADYLKISHPDLSSTELTLPSDLQPKKGYELTLMNKSMTEMGLGGLSIKTRPEDGASILLNKQLMKQVTPYTYDVLIAGYYLLSVYKQGYKPIDTIVLIQTDEIIDIEITLKKTNPNDKHEWLETWEKQIELEQKQSLKPIKYEKVMYMLDSVSQDDRVKRLKDELDKHPYDSVKRFGL